MSEFVRFQYEKGEVFNALVNLFEVLKKIKNDLDTDFDWKALQELLPKHICINFDWPVSDEPQFDPSRPIKISPPGTCLGGRWNFAAILELIEMGDYELRECKAIDRNHAEMSLEAFGYPYGGVNPLIALIEGFGFVVVGFNECGVYEEL